MTKTNGNLYSNLLFRSYDLFEVARQRSIKLMNQNRKSEIRACWGQVIDLTRKATVVSSVEEFHLESAKKTAVIVMGLSCSGKSTIARRLKKQYPNTNIIGFDEIGMVLAEENTVKYMLRPDLLEEDIVVRMGEMLDEYSKSNQNLLVEGNYLSLNARGALMKALRQLGFKRINLISTLTVPAENQEKYAEKRALIYVYSDSINELDRNKFILRTYDEDVMPEIESKADLQQLKSRKEYSEYLHHLEKCRYNEFISDMVPIQYQYDLLLAGADLFVEWF